MAAGLNTQGKLQITELDFDDIKSNLKTYLKGQSQFTDFDFEASGINILLDTLAYNTHYQAFQANMLANEMFLDTAVKRNSVTSHAKALGYTPTSAKAPIAYVKVQVNDANTASVTMPEGFVFTTTIDGVTYRFVNITARTVSPSAGVYIFGETSGIPIYEGTRPYEKIPFQWSCHSKTDQGAIDHTEFLASPASDPRRAFAESLIAHIGVSGSVVVYSSFEKGVLTALENQFPDLGDELRAIKERLWDLLEVVRNNYYHPEIHGSYSIKAVLPALVPELAYDDLALQAGDSASDSFQNLVLDKALDDDDKNRIESELKSYCARDTLAMFKILGRLTSISA